MKYPEMKYPAAPTMRERALVWLYAYKDRPREYKIVLWITWVIFLLPPILMCVFFGAGGIFAWFGIMYVMGAAFGNPESRPKGRHRRLRFRFFRHIRYH